MVFISDEDAKPFYDGEKSYNGPWQVKIKKNKSVVIEEDTFYAIRLADPAGQPCNKFYKIESLKENEYPDFLINLEDNSFTCLRDPALLNISEVEFYITEKNNPLVYIGKITHNIENKIFDTKNFNEEKYSLYSQSIFGNAALTPKNYSKDAKPFDLININDNYIVKVNPLGVLNFMDHDPKIGIEFQNKIEEINLLRLVKEDIIVFNGPIKVTNGFDLINIHNRSPNEIKTKWFLDLFEAWKGSVCFALNGKLYVKYANGLKEGDTIAITDKNNKFMTHHIFNVNNESDMFVIIPSINLIPKNMEILIQTEDLLEKIEISEINNAT